jgi:acetylornithine deacetylase/succinyl-diaminopimelate desuccinylase-like protein
VTPSHADLVAELAELIAIPSVSADPAHAEDVRRAAEWVRARVEQAGGSAELVPWGERPLVLGGVDASRGAESAPTILLYGHFDVQPPDPLDGWISPPFELTERDGHLYGRGVVDDKGQLYMLLKAVEGLAQAGELPVNVRVACDGEEEVGGHSIVEWLAQDPGAIDAALVFDGGMVERDVPAFNVAVRGLVYFHVRVRTGGRDLHSGVYGGASMNAMHALVQTLSGVLPRDGRVPEQLRVGVVPPTPEEVAGWGGLPTGEDELRSARSQPADPDAAREFYLRTWAEPSVDVNGIQGGSPVLQKTVIPVEAQANVSIRLVAEQDPDEIAATFERLLREAAPAGAEVTVERWSSAPPGMIPADAPALVLAQDAFEQVLGRRPLLIRTGGAIPLVSALAGRGVPTILSGFALNDSNIHSPNECLVADYLSLGVETARELLRRLGELR